MRIEKRKHLVPEGMIDGKHCKCRQREKMTESMAQWRHSAKMIETLRIMKEKEGKGTWL